MLSWPICSRGFQQVVERPGEVVTWGFSRVVIAAGPRWPKTHVVARFDYHAPVLAFILGRLPNKPELYSKSLNLERGHFDPPVLDVTQRRQHFIAPGNTGNFID